MKQHKIYQIILELEFASYISRNALKWVNYYLKVHNALFRNLLPVHGHEFLFQNKCNYFENYMRYFKYVKDSISSINIQSMLPWWKSLSLWSLLAEKNYTTFYLADHGQEINFP